MSYMESGPCYQPNRGKNTTKTVQREVPRTSQPAPIQARPTAIGDAPATTSVENFRKENDNEPLDMSHCNLTKKTTPVDVPKEISHVDPKMGKRKRKRTLSSSSSSSSCSASSNSSSASNDTTFSKAADPEVDLTEEVAYSVKEVETPMYIPSNKDEVGVSLIAEISKNRLLLNIGGKKFETSASTLKNEPDGLLAEMISKDSAVAPYKTEGLTTYFLDRNPRFFDFVLDYLRDPLNFVKILPSNKQVLRQLHVEATYYRLTGLVEILEQQGRSSIWEK